MTHNSEPGVLATKLHPRASRGLLHRPRLLERLRPADHRLTLVAAPAGWGKTSLVGQWYSAQEQARVAWLSLDAADDDPVSFWTHVVAAVRTRAPDSGRRAPAAPPAGDRPPQGSALPLSVDELVEDLVELPGPLVLVLDDYHAITEPAVHEAVTLLLEHPSPHVHLLMTVRGDPPLPLGRLRAAGELGELRTDALAFTDDEVGAVLERVPGLELSSADVMRLARRTEGWPTGVSLAAASLAGRAGDVAAFIDEFTGTDRYVLDYLCREVIDRLPPDRSAFLLRTSILDRLSPSLCAALTGRSDAAAVLDGLDRGAVFLVALDSERRWYRHHRLFGELLRHELSLSEPTEVPQLHRRAAAWWEANGAVGEAVTHHVAAGATAAAVDLVARVWREPFREGRHSTVAGWLDLLPPPAVRADPRLCVARAWLQTAAAGFDHGRDDAGCDDGCDDDGWLDDGWLDDRWLAAGELLAGPADHVVLRDLAVLRAVRNLGIGHVGAATAAARRALERSDGEACFAVTIAHLVLGIGAYWGGDLSGARRRLVETVRMARRTAHPEAEISALGHLALTDAERGAPDAAASALALATEVAVDAEGFVAGHLGSALPSLAEAVLLTATGRAGAAEESAARALELARRGSGRSIGSGRLVTALALAVRAQAADARGGDGRGWLDEARRLARDCPDPGRLPARLARIRLSGPGSVQHPPAGIPSTGAAPTPLSDRERGLLPLLAGPLSQREIGGVLHLSLNTVKTHCRGLFRKLGVSSRGDAVVRARELGLL